MFPQWCPGSKLLVSRVAFALADFLDNFLWKSGYPDLFYPDILTLFYICIAKPQTDSCDMKQLAQLSVFDTLFCMYDCMRCSTAGFMRHLFSNTSTTAN